MLKVNIFTMHHGTKQPFGDMFLAKQTTIFYHAIALALKQDLSNRKLKVDEWTMRFELQDDENSFNAVFTGFDLYKSFDKQKQKMIRDVLRQIIMDRWLYLREYHRTHKNGAR